MCSEFQSDKMLLLNTALELIQFFGPQKFGGFQ